MLLNTSIHFVCSWASEYVPFELVFQTCSIYVEVPDIETAAWTAFNISARTGIALRDVRPMAKSRYYKNKWRAIKDAPEEYFEDCEFDLLMEMIPFHLESNEHVAVIRASNQKTGKVKEYSYKRMSAANKRCRDLIISEEPLEITLVTDQGMCVLLNYHPYKDEE